MKKLNSYFYKLLIVFIFLGGITEVTASQADIEATEAFSFSEAGRLLSEINHDLQTLNEAIERERLRKGTAAGVNLDSTYMTKQDKYIQTDLFSPPSVQEMTTRLFPKVIKYKKALAFLNLELEGFSLELSFSPSITLDFIFKDVEDKSSGEE